MIRLRVLGSLDLLGESGKPSSGVLQQPKRAALLAYLAIAAPARFERRDRLLALFWPELDLSRARDALNSAVRFLRRELGEHAIVSRGNEEIAVDATRVSCDVAEFRRALEQRDYADAIARYQGDLLDGFHCDASPEFDDWLERARTELRALAGNAARSFSEQRERDGSITTAVACARRAVALSDGNERVVRQLLELLDRLGDRAGALHAYDQFAKRLAAEFEAEPSAETRELIKRIRTNDAVSSSRPAASGLAGGAAPPAARDRLPHIPGLVLERELGHGGMSMVYLAHDAKHDRPVALKVLREELTFSLGIERFLKEVRITARLAHPHILPLLDSGSHEGRLYFMAPFVPEGSLRDRLDQPERLSVPLAIRLGREIASALAYAHKHGIIHRDIKPDNVLLADGHAVVADFGIARAISAATEGAPSDFSLGAVMGSRAYQSPELFSGTTPADERCDVFALGCVLHEMLTGVRPTVGNNTGHMLHERGVPAPVADLVVQCMQEEPARRPHAARDIMDALDAY